MIAVNLFSVASKETCIDIKWLIVIKCQVNATLQLIYIRDENKFENN